MDEESIAATSSEEVIETDAPSEPAAPEAPAEPVETPEPGVPAAETFELPDGRKVDASQLAKEWKENFLPDYTRKSQALAEKTRAETLTDNKPKENVYEDPEYVPQSYEEILRVAEDRALAKLDAREQAKVEQQQAIENEVVSQLNELKSLDPTLNENALFLHANKYGFRDLKLAHANMRDMSDVVKKTQTATAQNIAKRNDPVSVTPGASGQNLNPDHFGSAVEYLRALKGTGKSNG